MNVHEGSADERASAGRSSSPTSRSGSGRWSPSTAIDLEVQAGEFIALLGPSGCGKTTTLRMLAGFEQPDAGYIRISGQYVQGIPPHKRDVNTVFQHYALFPHMTVAENVAYGLRQKRHRQERDQAARRRGLEMVKMTRLADRKPRQMSGGQQQRVALARALVNRPSVLLLDEPLGALDRKLREEMQIELKLLQTQVGITFIFVTHDQEEALSMSDRIAVMLDGHVEQLADPDIDLRQPPVGVRRGLHRSATTSSRAAPTATDTELDNDRDGVHVIARPAGPTTSSPASPAIAAVRPEAITIVRRRPRARRSTSSPARLGGISHLGDVIQFVVLARAGGEIIVRQPRHQAPKLTPGQEVWCSWAPERAHLFSARQADLVMLTDPAAEEAAV